MRSVLAQLPPAPIVTNLSSKFQTVVPAKLRKKFNISQDNQLIWSVDENADQPTVKVVFKKKKKLGEYMRGLGQEIWQDIDTDKYINDLRDEWER